ncbi:hypothetical protein DEMA109039_15520 [Deinococcus marmoris]
MPGHAGNHELGRGAEALGGPVLPHQFLIAPDAARREDDGPGIQVKIVHHHPRTLLAAQHVRHFQNVAVDAMHHTVGDVQAMHAVAELENDSPCHYMLAHPAFKRLHHPRPGSPGDVETRHAVAGAGCALPAALGPAHTGKELHALRRQPAVLLPGGKVHIGFGPFAGPVVLGAVKSRRVLPVAPRQFVAVTDFQAALLWRINEKKSSERPERLTAQILLAFLVQQQHALSGVGGLGGGHQSGQPRADHDDVGVMRCHENSSGC